MGQDLLTERKGAPRGLLVNYNIIISRRFKYLLARDLEVNYLLKIEK